MIHLDGDRVLLGQNCASANQAGVVGPISPDSKAITLNSPDATKVMSSREGQTQGAGFKLSGSDHHSRAFEYMETAVWQVREVLGLMRTK